jgi:hypothetical protein
MLGILTLVCGCVFCCKPFITKINGSPSSEKISKVELPFWAKLLMQLKNKSVKSWISLFFIVVDFTY